MLIIFRKKLREMLNLMGVNDIDEDLLDSLQRQLFQFLEFDDSLAGGITFKTGSILTTLQVQNYQEIREKIQEGFKQGQRLGSNKLNLKLSLSSFCLYLTEEHRCQITDDQCPFEMGTQWEDCEIVQSSCENPEEEEWK